MSIERLIQLWASDKCRDVMLPGLGSKTCGEIAEMLRDACERLVKESQHD